MVESMLTFMLGPLRQITDFYMEHLLVSNSNVIRTFNDWLFIILIP